MQRHNFNRDTVERSRYFSSLTNYWRCQLSIDRNPSTKEGRYEKSRGSEIRLEATILQWYESWLLIWENEAVNDGRIWNRNKMDSFGRILMKRTGHKFVSIRGLNGFLQMPNPAKPVDPDARAGNSRTDSRGIRSPAGVRFDGRGDKTLAAA